jgi:hypothetical protein
VICTIASPNLAKAITILRLVGLPGLAVVADYGGGRPRAVTYAVNIVRGEDIRLSVDGRAITQMPRSSTHQPGDQQLFEPQTRRLSEVLELAGDLGYIR